MDMGLFTVNAVAGLAGPKSTAVAPVKLVPVITTVVPPALGPVEGLTPVTVGGGGGLYVNWSLMLVALVPPPFETVTSTTPDAPAGEVAVMEPGLFTVNAVAGFPDPKSTVVAPVKLVPVMATEVPPVLGPDDGLTP